MQQEYNRFKLDAASIPIVQFPQRRIIVYNFNIPIALVQDRAIFQRVQQQIESDLPAGAPGTIHSAYFQITAAYTLVHQETNETRFWLGSFSPRARDLAQVTTFRSFNANSFVDFCILNAAPERVINKLTAVVNGRNSVWTLDNLISIIISVQATVDLQHLIFTRQPSLAHFAHQRRRNVFRIYFD
jgi:hypothetical protein